MFNNQSLKNIKAIVKRELSVFSDISFEEKSHTYTRPSGGKYTSVTTAIKSVQAKFNTDYWLIYKSLQRSGFTVKKPGGYDTILINGKEYYMPEYLRDVKLSMEKDDRLIWKPSEIQKEWTDTNVWGTTKGTGVHDYIEYSKFHREDYQHSDKYLNTYRKEWPILKSQVDAFFEDHPHLVWLGSEIRIADDNVFISGTVDGLFWNTITRQLEIWDWKTNKKFTTKNFFDNLKYPFSNYDDCDEVKYSIQLGLYKYIIEKNTNLKLGDSTIVWFFEGNDSYRKIKTKRLSEEINNMI